MTFLNHGTVFNTIYVFDNSQRGKPEWEKIAYHMNMEKKKDEKESWSSLDATTFLDNLLFCMIIRILFYLNTFSLYLKQH